MPRSFQVQPGGAVILPTACVDDESANAQLPLATNKTRHLHRVGTNFDLAVGATPASREEIVYRARTAAVLKMVEAVLEESGTSTAITVDCKVYNAANPTGVSLLSAPISLVHGTGDWTAVSGVIASANLAAGDIVTLATTVTSATGAAGLFAHAEIDEPLS